MASYYTPRRTTGSGLRYTMRNPDTTSHTKTLRVDPYWLLDADETYARVPDYGRFGHEERAILAHRGSSDMLPSDEKYTEKLNRILSAAPCIGVPPRPSAVAPGIFIGTQANGENLECLKGMKITHVLNCAGLPESLKASRAARYRNTNIIYEELPIDDDEGFPVKNFFSAAHTFMERGRISGGRVLVHCTGVSRCGAVVIAYLVRSGHRLMEAAQEVKRERRCALCNQSFMKQLVEHARQHGMLEPELNDVKAPRYGRRIDDRRIWSAHLPTVL